jgi:hypothetical protein
MFGMGGFMTGMGQSYVRYGVGVMLGMGGFMTEQLPLSNLNDTFRRFLEKNHFY